MEKSFKDRLKAIRKERNLTQHKFGKVLGISGKMISVAESGKGRLSESVLKLIESEYLINRKWLLTGQGKKDLSPFLKENGAVYDLHGGFAADPRRRAGLPKGSGWGFASRMLYEIFQGDDAELKQRTLRYLATATGRAGAGDGIDDAAHVDRSRRMAQELARRYDKNLDDNQLLKLAAYLDIIFNRYMTDAEKKVLDDITVELIDLL